MDLSKFDDPYILKHVGKELKKARINRDLTQDQVRAQSGLPKQTITNIEGGKNFSFTTLIRYLRAINMLDRLNELFPAEIPNPLEFFENGPPVRQRAKHKRK